MSSKIPELKWLNRHSTAALTIATLLFYVWSRWFGMTNLPVFADESIYIRWSQLLRVGPEYWFFALNDGKPPLFVWTLFPWLNVFADPLRAARTWSALIGLVQVGVIWGILRSLKQNRLAQWLGVWLVLLTPFWFLHHRLGLMDGLLTLGITLAFWGLIELDTRLENNKALQHWKVVAFWTLVAGAGWGIALLTKTTALFIAPLFLGVALFGRHWNGWSIWQSTAARQTFVIRLIIFGICGLIGLSLFALLRVHPAFGSLFSRSGDFSYSVSEWAELGGLPTWRNMQRVVPWIAQYLRPELLTFALSALLLSRFKRLHGLLWLAGVVTILPLILFGKTLHPRYFLPLVPFITLSAASFGSEVWVWTKQAWDKKQPDLAWIGTAICLMFLLSSLRFQLLLQMSPHLTPFTLDDREQYLTSWAAGYGVPQVRDRLFERARAGQRTTVVTEGSFGTLPDGLLMYFDQADEIEHIRIEGLEQFPVKYLPDWVLEQAATEETWLLVNEDRFALSPEQQNRVELISSTAKPYGGPPLLLFRVLPE